MWVLLIEDDEGTAKSIELMLKAKNHTCDIKRLGADGLAAAGLYTYDVILLDLMLPDMDGFEVLRRLRANQIDAPVLSLSGLSDAGHKAKGINIGADSYPIKPFDNREPLSRIARAPRLLMGHHAAVAARAPRRRTRRVLAEASPGRGRARCPTRLRHVPGYATNTRRLRPASCAADI